MKKSENLILSAKAMTLRERLCLAPRAEDDVDSRDMWMKKAVGNNIGDFKRRLACQGLLYEQIPALLSTPDVSEPAWWTRELNKILEPLPSTPEALCALLRYNPIQKKADFFSYLTPILLYMENRIKSALDSGLFTDSACVNIMENGFNEVNLLFGEFALDGLNKKADYFISLKFEYLSDYYGAFCGDMLENGLERAFLEYPTLGRMLMYRIDNWVRFIGEIEQRITSDLTALSDSFGCSGKVSGLLLSCGDKHNGGRSTATVIFSNGIKVVYKPRPSDTDEAFRGYIDFLNSIGAVSLKTPKTLSFKEYSYAEFIERKPLKNESAAKNYYIRAGQLLCAVHMLGSCDLHNENIIACGEYPFIVDTETILTPVVASFAGENYTEAQKLIQQSVAFSGMLFIENKTGLNKDIGGIALTQSDNSNSPFLADGSSIDYDKCFSYILNGFESAYRIVLGHKKESIEKLGLFDGCLFRFLFRNSQIYSDIIMKTTELENMKDGLAQSFEIERLFTAYRGCGDDNKLNQLYNIFDAECRSIEEGDIPIFYVEAAGRDILSGNINLYPDFFMDDAINHAKSKIENMSDEDISLQLKLINQFCRRQKTNNGDSDKNKSIFETKTDEVPYLSAEEYLEEATSIFETIMELSVTVSGRPYWVVNDIASMSTGVRICDNSLYEGKCGLAVFFGALYKATGDNKYKTATIDLIKTCYDEFSYRASKTPVGALDGIGGLGLSLAVLSEYLHMPELLQRGYGIVTLDTIDFGKTESTDYMHGLAGYITVLSRFYANFPIKSHIIEAANRLTALRSEYGGFNAWIQKSSNNPILGLAHGTSGIAMALALAYQQTGNAGYLSYSSDAVDYENHFYDPANGWPDFRRALDDKREYMCGFCSGAPGIGLSRLNMLGISKNLDAVLLNDIEKAIIHSRNFTIQRWDHLCCGNAGRIDLLVSAGKKLNRVELLTEAGQLLSWMVAHKKHCGHYQLLNAEANLQAAGLFTGLAGIGYEMLRMAYAEDENIIRII